MNCGDGGRPAAVARKLCGAGQTTTQRSPLLKVLVALRPETKMVRATCLRRMDWARDVRSPEQAPSSKMRQKARNELEGAGAQ